MKFLRSYGTKHKMCPYVVGANIQEIHTKKLVQTLQRARDKQNLKSPTNKLKPKQKLHLQNTIQHNEFKNYISKTTYICKTAHNRNYI